MEKEQNDWFENWFDTPYYHTLYHKRNHDEASQFLDALINFLNPSTGAKFLDLACGKGRHSIYLNAKGFDVCGVDLSANSINFAKRYSSDTLNFAVHDMRQLLHSQKFDYVLNVFTSFGYFNDPYEDRLVIKNVKQILKPGGVFVLDYFNAAKPNLNFDSPFTKRIDGIKFDIIKKIIDDRIIKTIEVTDKNKVYTYTEQVRLYTLEQLVQIIEQEGLEVCDIFGNYALESYSELTSERLIIIAKN